MRMLEFGDIDYHWPNIFMPLKQQDVSGLYAEGMGKMQTHPLRNWQIISQPCCYSLPVQKYRACLFKTNNVVQS